MLKILDIDNFKFTWGTELSEFMNKYPEIIPEKPYDDWSMIRFYCRNIIGVPTLMGQARSPAVDRPIMQISFDLADPELSNIDECTIYWLKIIDKLIGKPYAESKKAPYKNADPSGCVVYNGKWLIGEIGLNLSVYGGKRETPYGVSVGGLFFDWKDDIRAASPYHCHFMDTQKEINNATHNLESIKYFDLGTSQTPFHIPDYESNEPHKALMDDTLRVAQKCLYRKKLFETPEAIKKMLKENSVAVWQCRDNQSWGISTFCDTIYIENREDTEIGFLNVLPAKGEGGMYLSVESLSLNDKANSSSLKKIVKKIEKIINRTVECDQRYDC